MELRWLASFSSSCFHAAAALVRGEAFADTRLTEALSVPVAELAGELSRAAIPAEAFFEHLVPLAAGVENNRELARLVLVKLCGSQHGPELEQRLAGRLSDVESAFRIALPGVVDELELRSGPLREQWEARGPGLLAAVERKTEHGLLAASADVVLVHPALGGAGTAHLPYNTVTIEAVLANPLAELPEVVRLGWLLSTLNLDLPRFSESIPRRRLPSVAAWAMLPPSLAAAEEVELVRNAAELLPRALSAWKIAPLGNAAIELENWWATYQESRPAWQIALAALDRMLTVGGPGFGMSPATES